MSAERTISIVSLVPEDADGWQEFAVLAAEYAASLDVDLSYQGFDEEMASLPSMYGVAPACAFLARVDGRGAGCIGLRQHRLGGELKRLWVAPWARGLGLGRALAERAIAAARDSGLKRVVLDTLPSMTGARMLYAGLGFEPIEPYYDTPVQGTSFLALDL